MKNERWITGLFMDRQSADRAVNDLLEANFKKSDISVLMTDATRQMHFGPVTATTPGPDKGGSKVSEGIGVGGTVGASLGAVLAGIAAIGTVVVLPGIGLIVAGPILAALAGAGAGAAAGGLVGGLAGLGISEDRATYYEKGLREGGIVVGVKARSEEEATLVEKWLGETGAGQVRAA